MLGSVPEYETRPGPKSCRKPRIGRSPQGPPHPFHNPLIKLGLRFTGPGTERPDSSFCWKVGLHRLQWVVAIFLRQALQDFRFCSAKSVAVEILLTQDLDRTTEFFGTFRLFLPGAMCPASASCDEVPARQLPAPRAKRRHHTPRRNLRTRSQGAAWALEFGSSKIFRQQSRYR